MNDIEFNKSIRNLNKAYRDLFGSIPCIQNFSCTRDDYVAALKKSISEKIQIENILNNAVTPTDKDLLI